MTNHYHLLIETSEGNLSLGIRQMNGVYTQLFNRWHGKIGHLFQGKYKAILTERDCPSGEGPLFHNQSLAP
jgi:putative transposase